MAEKSPGYGKAIDLDYDTEPIQVPYQEISPPGKIFLRIFNTLGVEMTIKIGQLY